MNPADYVALLVALLTDRSRGGAQEIALGLMNRLSDKKHQTIEQSVFPPSASFSHLLD